MKATHHYAPYLAVAGLGLSMLHQSSLGAVYGVLKAHPLWYRPDVSVLFIISAVAGGMALTVLASMLAARCTRSANVDDSVLERASLIVGWILAAYLYFRFWDALSMTYTYEPGRTEGLRLLTSGPLAFNFWVSEMLLGTLVPMILLLNRKARSRPFWRMAALALVVLGVVTYRWDTNLSGQLVVLAYLPGSPAVAYTSYVPSMVEILSAAGVIGYGLLAFSLGVRHLRVVDHGVETERAEKPARQRVPEPAAAD
jgi:molybdopterin-containing oxidoreductase family membrane subunit